MARITGERSLLKKCYESPASQVCRECPPRSRDSRAETSFSNSFKASSPISLPFKITNTFWALGVLTLMDRNKMNEISLSPGL